MVWALRSKGYDVAVVPLVYTRNIRGFFGEQVFFPGSLVSQEKNGVYQRPPLYRRILDLLYKRVVVRKKVFEFTKSFDPDVVVATIPAVEAPTIGYWLCRRLGCKLIVDVQDLADDYRILERPWLSLPIKLYFNGVYKVLKNADILVSTTEHTSEVLLVRTGNKNILLVPNGVDNSRFNKCFSLRLKLLQHGINDEIRGVFLGNLDYRYHAEAVDFFIDVVDFMSQQGINVYFDVVGTGAFIEKLKKKVKHLGLQDRVVLHGFLPDIKMIEILARADFAVAGRPFSRNKWALTAMRVTVYEYLSCGLPILGFGPPGAYMGYFIEHYDVGIYIPAKSPKQVMDATVQLAEKVKRDGIQLARHCRDVAELYDWRKIMLKFVEDLESQGILMPR
jgi:glycosyltransferase involved in cell wall biosynthesis